MNKKRILLVDDETSFTRLLKLNLEQTDDYEVRVENWAEDALMAAREFRPDLVLLDVMMPRMIGGGVAALLRADASLKETPIRSEEHTSELQSPCNLVCRLLLEKKKKK